MDVCVCVCVCVCLKERDRERESVCVFSVRIDSPRACQDGARSCGGRIFVLIELFLFSFSSAFMT